MKQEYKFEVQLENNRYTVKDYYKNRSLGDYCIGKYYSFNDAVTASKMFQDGKNERDVETVLGYF